MSLCLVQGTSSIHPPQHLCYTGKNKDGMSMRLEGSQHHTAEGVQVQVSSGSSGPVRLVESCQERGKTRGGGRVKKKGRVCE